MFDKKLFQKNIIKKFDESRIIGKLLEGEEPEVIINPSDNSNYRNDLMKAYYGKHVRIDTSKKIILVESSAKVACSYIVWNKSQNQSKWPSIIRRAYFSIYTFSDEIMIIFDHEISGLSQRSRDIQTTAYVYNKETMDLFGKFNEYANFNIGDFIEQNNKLGIIDDERFEFSSTIEQIGELFDKEQDYVQQILKELSDKKESTLELTK